MDYKPHGRNEPTPNNFVPNGRFEITARSKPKYPNPHSLNSSISSPSPNPSHLRSNLNKSRRSSATMPFWNQGGGAHEEPDDFEEYDPTPYGGGYDLHLTFGRPIPPSDETCYPISTSSSTSVDYDRPSYSSGSKPSAYDPESDVTGGDRYGHSSRPKPGPQAAYGFQPKPQYGGEETGYGSSGYSNPKPQYGEESAYGSSYSADSRPKPQHGGGGGEESEYGYSRPKPQYGGGEESEYGYSRPKPQYGGGGGEESEHGYSRPKPQYGGGEESEYGYSRPKPQYGGGEESEYGYSRPKPQFGVEESEYGYSRPNPKPQYGGEESELYGSSGYSRPNPKPQYGGEESELYGSSGYSRPKPQYGGEESEYGSGYSKPSYGEDEEGSGKYKKSEGFGYGGERSNYGQGEGEEYNRPKYVRFLFFNYLFFLPVNICIVSSM